MATPTLNYYKKSEIDTKLDDMRLFIHTFEVYAYNDEYNVFRFSFDMITHTKGKLGLNALFSYINAKYGKTFYSTASGIGYSLKTAGESNVCYATNIVIDTSTTFSTMTLSVHCVKDGAIIRNSINVGSWGSLELVNESVCELQ